MTIAGANAWDYYTFPLFSLNEMVNNSCGRDMSWF